VNRIGPVVAILGWNVVLLKLAAIDPDPTIIDRNGIAWQPDDTLDVRLRRIFGKPEDDSIPPVDGAQPEFVTELVNEQALLIVEAGHHAGTFHFYGPV